MLDETDKPPKRTFSTRAELLRETLTAEIISGKLQPGARLDEQEIADRFGVSRTPVREAVRHLVATGLAQSQPHHGATVSGFNSDRITAFLDAATELEVACVRLAAMRMTKSEIDKLVAIHAETSRNLFDEATYYDLNDRFHDVIYLGAHNEVITEMMHTMRSRIGPVYRAQNTLAHRARQSYAEHDRIVAAVLSGDAIAAEVAMRAHMASSAMILERLHGNVLGALTGIGREKSGEPASGGS